MRPRGDLPRPLARSFFGRSAPTVARALLGRLLVKQDDQSPDGALVARIVETEAYQEDDPASHSYGGPRGRNVVMFGPAGFLYVYFTYGMHFCMNVVTGRAAVGSAVLLRAAEPIRGVEAMRSRRGRVVASELCAGPARLTQAFGIDRSWNGAELCAASGLWIGAGRPVPDDLVARGRRVGIRRGIEQPLRYWVRGSAFVSGPRRARDAAEATRASGPMEATGGTEAPMGPRRPR